MAYTTFQKTFWSDDYVLTLDAKQKLVFNYLITNEKTRQCGIYQIAISKACFELGLQPEEFILYLKRFSDDKKIYYSIETNEICIINWLKHNENKSWKTMESVKKQLLDVKNPALVLLLYTPSKPLFEGKRKVKTSTGGYVDEPFTIDNPWKDYFKELSESEILELRKPYFPEGACKGLICGIDGASTITVHNNTKTKHKQDSTETLQDNTVAAPFQTYIEPEEEPQAMDLMSDVMIKLAAKKGMS